MIFADFALRTISLDFDCTSTSGVFSAEVTTRIERWRYDHEYELRFESQLLTFKASKRNSSCVQSGLFLSTVSRIIFLS